MLSIDVRKTRLKQAVSAGFLSLAIVGWSIGCKSRPVPRPPTPTATASANLPEVGGQKAIELRRLQSGVGAKPEFLSVTVLPGRGMNVFQITAYLPGRGEVPLLASQSVAAAAKIMNGGPDDLEGNQSFSMGGALLFPFANRLVGPVTVDRNTGDHIVTATWHGRSIPVIANWHGKQPGAPWCAMHGQMLAAKADNISIKADSDSAAAIAEYRLPANGHWFSDNDVKVTVALDRDTVTAIVTATNRGDKSEPVGIGWHPYFQLPSGSRANARVRIASPMRVEVNNYDDVFPTGKLLPVAGTQYDFNAMEGQPLPDTLVDDTFVDLTPDAQGNVVSEIRDLGANYGMRVTAMSPHVRAIQLYSPLNKSFIALEPQFNYGDPFGREWNGADTGMVTLAPGESVTWKVQLQLFQPANDMVGQAPRPNVP
ncbi:MAG: aldose 1-epimerase [Acidobacteriaceae bacterium]